MRTFILSRRDWTIAGLRMMERYCRECFYRESILGVQRNLQWHASKRQRAGSWTRPSVCPATLLTPRQQRNAASAEAAISGPRRKRAGSSKLPAFFIVLGLETQLALPVSGTPQQLSQWIPCISWLCWTVCIACARDQSLNGFMPMPVEYKRCDNEGSRRQRQSCDQHDT